MTDDKTCEDCKFFVQHYRVDDGKHGWVSCGHCLLPRFKTRKPTAKACSNFQENSPVD